MRAVRSRMRHAAAIGVAVILGLAAAAGLGACGGQETWTTETVYDSPAQYETNAPPTTYAATATTAAQPASDGGSTDSAAQPKVAALAGASGQKIIGDAVLDLEVANGGFSTAFTNAALLSDRYGGYIVASQSSASGDDGRVDAGTVAVRIPASSFSAAIADAGKLGTLKNQQITTQDVTEEYVDLQARIINSQAKLETFRKLFEKATTINDIVSVQQVVTAAEDELEQLKGRQRYLQEHTSYSTLTMNIREAGTETVITTTTTEASWGVGEAFSDAARNAVKALNAIVRALGIVIPVLVVLAIIAFIVYRAWHRKSRTGQTVGGSQPEGTPNKPEAKS
jgi:hypothetical protein